MNATAAVLCSLTCTEWCLFSRYIYHAVLEHISCSNNQRRIQIKKKTKIPCIHQEGIIHATAYAELYKHEFSLRFMIHTPVHHCRQLCSQLIHFWKKKNRKQMSSFARVLEISGFGEERIACHKSLATRDAFQQAYNNMHATTSDISYLR